MELILQLLVNGLAHGTLFALLAIAFGLVYRCLGIFHLAGGGMFVGAGYLFYRVVGFAMEEPTFQAWLSPEHSVVRAALLLLGLTLVAGMSFAGGALLEVVFYRPFLARRATPGAILVGSLGLFVVMENAFAVFFGNSVLIIRRPAFVAHSIGPINVTTLQLAQLVFGLVLTIAVVVALRRVRLLKALWAMGEEPELLALCGHNLGKHRMLVFGLSSALTGVAASLIGLDTGVDPHAGMHYFLLGVVAVIVGGTDHLRGWIVGAFLLALVNEAAIYAFASQWLDLATFLALAGVLLLRPQGVLSLRRRVEEGR